MKGSEAGHDIEWSEVAPTTPESLNLASAVFRNARSIPAATALVIEGHTYSYAKLAAAAANAARNLSRARGLELRVGILAARSFETYVGILGTAWVGGTYVPLNPKHPPARIAAILRRAALNALVVDKRSAPLLDLPELHDVLPSYVLRPGDLSPNTTAAGISTPAEVAPDHCAYIMFTSGTTGDPKGVVVTTGNVAHFLSCMRALYAITTDDRVGQFCETSFDVSVFEMFAAWEGGASLHVVPESKLMAPAGFIREQALTVWTCVPSVISMLSTMKLLEPSMFPSLRVSFFIGEALPVAAARAWQAAAPNSVVDNQYGPTETTVACLVHRLTAETTETPRRGIVPIGRPYPSLGAAILSPAGEFLPEGEPGELVLAGPQLAAGYLDDPQQTALRFRVLDHPRLGRTRWYLTGDLAVRDARGVFHWLGRIDNQVKIMGNRVELEDVEAHLRAASETDTVAALAWPIVDGIASGIVAFLAQSKVPLAQIRNRLRERLPSYMVPRQMIELDALPLSPHGKVDRRALRVLIEKGK